MVLFQKIIFYLVMPFVENDNIVVKIRKLTQIKCMLLSKDLTTINN